MGMCIMTKDNNMKIRHIQKDANESGEKIPIFFWSHALDFGYNYNYIQFTPLRL